MRGLVVVLWLGMASACHNGVDTPAPRSARAAERLLADTTICEIALAPERFVGKRVVVEGCITSDGQEYTALTQRVGYCDAGGLSPSKSPEYKPAEWFYPKPDERACGTFAGVFRGPDMLNSRVLEIEDAENVQIMPLR